MTVPKFKYKPKILTGKEMVQYLRDSSLKLKLEQQQKSKKTKRKDPKLPKENDSTRSTSKGSPGKTIKIGVKLRTVDDQHLSSSKVKAIRVHKRGSSITKIHSTATNLKLRDTESVEEDQRVTASGLRPEDARKPKPRD